MKRYCFRIAALLLSVSAAIPVPVRAQVATPIDANGIMTLENIAAKSQCEAHEWAFRRGTAPKSYLEGVALVFASAVCHPKRADVQIVSAPVNTSPTSDDALSVYQAQFNAKGMSNNKAGAATLRHSYALLIGLGMMESSGRYCEGRDTSECFSKSESAEAGLFQTSYGSRRFSPALGELFQTFSADQSHCLTEVFKGSINCKIMKSQNPNCPSSTSDVAGTGPGADWQRLTKSCPAFATEYGAVLLRKHGGPHGEFNPIRKQQAELRPECDSMLQAVETYVDAHPEVCSSL